MLSITKKCYQPKVFVIKKKILLSKIKFCYQKKKFVINFKFLLYFFIIINHEINQSYFYEKKFFFKFKSFTKLFYANETCVILLLGFLPCKLHILDKELDFFYCLKHV